MSYIRLHKDKELAKVLSATLRNPRATFDQKGLPIAAAIDRDAKSAWAIDPQFGKDHAAVFDLLPPIEIAMKSSAARATSGRRRRGGASSPS